MSRPIEGIARLTNEKSDVSANWLSAMIAMTSTTEGAALSSISVDGVRVMLQPPPETAQDKPLRYS